MISAKHKQNYARFNNIRDIAILKSIRKVKSWHNMEKHLHSSKMNERQIYLK